MDEPASKRPTFQVTILALSTAICFSSNLGFRRTSGIFFIYFQEDFDASATEASLVYSLEFSIMFLGGPFYSAYLKLFGSKVALMTSTLFLSVGYSGVFWVKNIPTLILFFSVLVGIGSGIGHLTCFTIVGKTFSTKRNLANNLMVCASMTVAMFSAPLFQYLMQYYSWRDVMLMQGAWLLNGFPFGWIAAKNFQLLSQPNKNKQSDINKRIGCDVNETKKLSKQRILYNSIVEAFDVSLLKDGYFWIFCLSCIGVLGWRHILAQYFVRYAIDIGIERQSAANMLTIRLASSLGISVAMGYLTSSREKTTNDNGKSCTFKFPNTAVVLAVTSWIMTIIHLLPIILKEYTGYLCYSIFIGIADGCIGALPLALIPVYFGEKRLSGALGFRSLTTGIYNLALPPLIGRWIDVTGNYKPSLYICSILTFVGGLSLLIVQKGITKRKKKMTLHTTEILL